jgi:GntR family transcriptional repressor for pyruvate dehydrogenase complex
VAKWHGHIVSLPFGYGQEVPNPSQRRPEAAELRGIGPVATTRRADHVAEQIRNLIIREEIAEGARLPAERDLAARFGASRPTVSQALRGLSLMGLVEIRHGSGAYVVRRPESLVAMSVNLMLDLDRDSAGHLMALRLWLEEAGVREAAERLSAESAPRPRPGLDSGTASPPGVAAESEAIEAAAIEAAAIGVALHRLRDCRDDATASELIAADTVFHATVVRASGNPYLATIFESVHSAVLRYQLRDWVDTATAPLWLRHGGASQQWEIHQPIAAAVIAGDPDAALLAVRRHHEEILAHLAQPPAGTGTHRPERPS